MKADDVGNEQKEASVHPLQRVVDKLRVKLEMLRADAEHHELKAMSHANACAGAKQAYGEVLDDLDSFLSEAPAPEGEHDDDQA